MNNTLDKTTVTDTNGQIAKAIQQGKIGEIVKAIYSNSKFQGKVATDNKGVVKVLDKNGVLQDITVKIISNRILTMFDPVNKKTTTIEYKAPVDNSVGMVKEVKSLQDQLLDILKKKKMKDSEVILILKNLTNGK
jgi:fumarylacetoacetate (FAA) hydrolase family protein